MVGTRGTEAALTALERHVSYFDADGDGQITLRQTFRGLRALGVSSVTSVLLTALINSFLGFLTHGGPSIKVSVRDIARGKHPFDTGSFDERGAFDEANFNRLFSAPSTEPPLDRLTAVEIRRVIHRRGDPKKPFGELGSRLSDWFSGREIQLLLCVASDCSKVRSDGTVERAISLRTLRRFYTGHLLFLLARAKRVRDARRRTVLSGVGRAASRAVDA